MPEWRVYLSATQISGVKSEDDSGLCPSLPVQAMVALSGFKQVCGFGRGVGLADRRALGAIRMAGLKSPGVGTASLRVSAQVPLDPGLEGRAARAGIGPDEVTSDRMAG
jgi:hypothetical protein